MKSDLELIVGSRFVQSMVRTSSGDTFVGTQTGIIDAHNHDTSSFEKPGLANAAGNLDTKGLFQTGSLSVVAVGANGLAVTYDYDSVDDSISTYSLSNQSDIVYPITIDGSDFVVLQSNARLEIFPLISQFRSRILAPAISVRVQLISNVVFFEELGLCGAITQRLVCGLEEDQSDWITIFEADEVSESAHLVSLTDSGQVLLVTQRDAFHINIRRTAPTKRKSIKAVSNSDIRKVHRFNDLVLFGTDRGLYVSDLDLENLERIDIGIHRRVTGFYLEDEGFWVFCETGIAYISTGQVKLWPRDYTTFPIEVLSFAASKNGLFVGTYEGIFHVRDGDNIHRPLWTGDMQTADKRVTAMATFQDALYAGSFSRGISQFSFDNETLVRARRSQLLDGVGITTLLNIGGMLVAGTDRLGIYLIEDGEEKRIEMPTSWLRDPTPITSLSKLRQESKLLFTTENEVGILCFAPHLRVCAAQTISSNKHRPRIVSSLQGAGDTIYLGTLRGGVFVTSLDSIQNDPSRKPPAINSTKEYSVFTLSPEEGETIWLGTNSGLFHLIVGDGTLRRIGKGQRIINSDINHGAAYVDGRGRHYIGGPYGYNSFTLDSLSTNTDATVRVYASSVMVDKVRFFTNRLSATSFGVSLLGEQSFIEIDLTVNDFRDLSANRYQHRLEGYEDDWIDDGDNTTISYSNLPPGDYIFRARGANSLGVWSTNEIAIPVKVLPPVWLSWWAICLYVAVVLLAAMLGKRIYDRQLLRHYALIQAQEDAAELARLEDDYQEQLESNERILEDMTQSSRQLLEIAEDFLRAQIDWSDTSSEAALESGLSGLGIIKLQQSLTKHTLLGDTTNLQALANDVTARVASVTSKIGRAVILNDAPDVEAPSQHAVYLAVVMYELLMLGTTGREHDSTIEPIVHLIVEQPEAGAAETSYEISVEDSGFPDEDDESLKEHLPYTLKLVASVGGHLEQTHARGNLVRASLQFPTIGER